MICLMKVWRTRSLHQNGFRKKVRRGVFLVGLSLMLYPMVSYIAPSWAQKKASVMSEDTIEQDALGMIEIPSIDVSLPIYEGTDEDVLGKGIGRITWSSRLPGKEGSHSLLAGHSGLPGVRLFDRLHELSEGDTFSIHMEGKIFTYVVVKMQVIRPEETHLLEIAPQRELVSLITCTPYGINTHRLIVTGARMEVRQ